ncbi:MAG: VCBS repeat-containing protein [Planctomycetales bacterium]|nr:VCBS repeat-containing protein [Planctomycetales bacterium]
MNTIKRRRSRRFDLLEQRLCLTAIGFVEHSVVNEPAVLTATLDVDNDGDQDIIAVRQGETTWLENLDGLGTFADPAVIIREELSDIVVADMDGDGNEDLIGSHLGLGLVWLKNLDGNHFFGHPNQIGSGSSGYVAGDVDGDGDGDIVSSTTWFENVSSEQPFIRHHFRTDLNPAFSHYRLADFDGDGDSEFVLLSYEARQPPTISIYDFSESSVRRVARFESEYDYSALDVLDYNADGRDDIAIVQDATVVLLRNENNGTSFVRDFEITTPAEYFLYDFSVVDFNQDGVLDVIGTYGIPIENDFLARSTPQTYVYLSNGETIESAELLTNDPLKSIVDVDGDGKLDFLHGDNFGNIRLVYNDLSRLDVAVSEMRWSPASSVIADIDSDGDLDVISASIRYRLDCPPDYQICGSTIQLLENVDGTLTAPRDIGEPRYVAVQIFQAFYDLAIEAVDVNGDGRLDIVWQKRHDNTADARGKYTDGWLRNDGNGDFTRVLDMPTNHLLVDMNSDGRLDALVGGREEIYWYQQLSDGEFSEDKTVADELRAIGFDRVFPFDFDDDGDQDLLVQTFADGPVAFRLENLGGGEQFARHREDVTLRSVTKMFDLNRDGFEDVATLLYEDGQNFVVVYYWDPANERFELKQTLIRGSQTYIPSLQAADLDNDGFLDFIDGEYWMRNDNGQLLDAQLIRPNLPKAAGFGDIDGDGDTDLAIGSRWYEQRVAGDVNDDGVFDSSDLVAVFQSAKYEDAPYHNATFEEGDWNGDGDFDSADLVFAFSAWSEGRNNA